MFQNAARPVRLRRVESGSTCPYEYTGRVPTAEVKEQLADGRRSSRRRTAHGYFTGDNIQLAIGRGLFADAAAAGERLLHLRQRRHHLAAADRGRRCWRPARPTLSPGLVDLSQAQPTSGSRPVVVNHVDIAAGLCRPHPARVWSASSREHFPNGTAYRTVPDLQLRRLPDRRQDRHRPGGTKPAKDSSLFVGFGPIRPGTTPRLHDRRGDRAGAASGPGRRPRREVPLRRRLGPAAPLAEPSSPTRSTRTRPGRPCSRPSPTPRAWRSPRPGCTTDGARRLALMATVTGALGRKPLGLLSRNPADPRPTSTGG